MLLRIVSVILRNDQSCHCLSILHTVHSWFRVSSVAIGTISIAVSISVLVGITVSMPILCRHFMPHAVSLFRWLFLRKVAFELLVLGGWEEVDGKAENVESEDESDDPFCEDVSAVLLGYCWGRGREKRLAYRRQHRRFFGR